MGAITLADCLWGDVSHGRIPVTAAANLDDPQAKGLKAFIGLNSYDGRDLSCNGNHGTLVNSPVLSHTAYGSGLKCNGSSQYVDLGVKGITASDVQTIAFRLLAKGTNKTAYLFARNKNADRWASLALVYVSGYLVFSVHADPDNANTQLYNPNIIPWSSIKDGDHFAVVCNYPSFIVYQNGVAVFSGTSPYHFNANPEHQEVIGRAGAYNNYYFDGAMSDFRVYNRPLSAREVAEVAGTPWKAYRQGISFPDGLFTPAGNGGALNASAAGGDTAAGVATLSAQVALYAVGVALAGGSAQRRVAVPLSATGISLAGGVANGVAQVSISAAALAQAAGQAGLSASVLRAASGAAQAAGSATLAAKLDALAAGSAQAGGSANLTGGAPGALAATGGAAAGGAAVLSVTVQLQATGAATASGVASLTGGAAGALSAAGSASAAGWATWSSLVTVTAAGFVRAMGAGVLKVSVALAASGGDTAGGTASAALHGETKLYRLAAAATRAASAAASARRLTTVNHEVTHA